MIVYVSKIKEQLNRRDLNTEFHSDYICLNPKYPGITIKNKSVKILMDSGAFQDTESHKRVAAEKALARQLEFEKRLGVVSERIVAYDRIGDTETTLKNNEYLVSRREELKPRQLVLMVQGKTTSEYIECLERTSKMADPLDCVGFGGVALAGKHGDLRSKLMTALNHSVDRLKSRGIGDVHIFGVGTIGVLKDIGEVFRDVCCFNISCDTATIEIGSVMGRVLSVEEERWEKVYDRKDKYINYHPCDLMHINIKRAIQVIGRI